MSERISSFKHAFDGFVWAFSHHPNFRIHAVISFLVIATCWYIQVTRTEFIILVFTILIGFIVEMVNTAIEEITDLVTIKWARQAKVAKDVSAAMMLLTAISASIIGLLIFLPYII